MISFRSLLLLSGLAVAGGLSAQETESQPETVAPADPQSEEAAVISARERAEANRAMLEAARIRAQEAAAVRRGEQMEARKEIEALTDEEAAFRAEVAAEIIDELPEIPATPESVAPLPPPGQPDTLPDPNAPRGYDGPNVVRVTPGSTGDLASLQRRRMPRPNLPVDVPWWYELPLATRKELPDIAMTVHYFSDQPHERFVKINGERVMEGDPIDEGPLSVVEIRRDAVVLAFDSQPFLYADRR